MDAKKLLPYKAQKNLTEEQKKLLEPFVSHPNSDIFVLKDLQGIVGAAFARYSRQKGGIKDTLLELVVNEKIDPVKSRELMERILIQFGDDSVGELEGAHIALENISNLATKEIEDRRIGGSPIEQSSRYVVYDHTDENGNYRYYKDDRILNSAVGEEYVRSMDYIFKMYCKLQEPVKAFFGRKKPLEEAEYDILGTGTKQRFSDMPDEKSQKDFQRTYNIDLKTKTCDTLRCLLPAGTLTNMGLYGNGRFFQNLLSHLYTAPLPEMNTLAVNMHEALDTIIPVFVKRSKKLAYISERNEKIEALVTELFGDVKTRKEKNARTTLLPRPKNGLEFLIFLCAEVLFPFTNMPVEQLRKLLKKKEKDVPGTCARIIDRTIGERKTRRDRPSRGYEYGYPFTFELVNDFGIYRDLQRHRMLTQQRQLLNPYVGYYIPSELVEAGFEKEAKMVYRRSAKLYESMRKELGGKIAQYAICFGFYLRYTMGMNLREVSHFTELRAGPQGHYNYRKVAQDMAKLLPKEFSSLVRFVDMGDYFWARGDSEAKQRQKERKLEERN